MNKEYLEETLNLLASVILIDKRVYPEEVETFASAVKRLSNLIDPNILFTDSMAADWFKANRATILERLNSEKRDVFIRNRIRNLSNFKDYKEIFYNMIRIAHADNDYHPSEHILIKQAAAAWNIPYDIATPSSVA